MGSAVYFAILVLVDNLWILLCLPKDSLYYQKIVNGEIALVESYPFQVAILRYSHLICGGSVISAFWILTAAHCLEDMQASSLSIRVSANSYRNGGYIVNVRKIFYHQKYDNSSMINDIGAMLLTYPLSFSSRVSPAKLPYSGQRIPTNKQFVSVSGWGLTSEHGSIPSQQLRQITIPVVAKKECRKYYKRYQFQEIYNGMFCAGLTQGKMDSCQGDSGGPVSIGNMVVGVVSFGFGCARPFYPGIYTQVSTYRSWIKEITGI